ncbi:dihydropyrimidine dehydrogenase, partial [Pseudomonas aeruginosa]
RVAMHGHDVEHFEARAKAGGLNEYGIGRYKLVDDFARREVEFLQQIGGIELRHGQRHGDNQARGAQHEQFHPRLHGISQ